MMYYISHADLPSRKAHSIQMVRMCEAFAKSGSEITLIHPSYGVNKPSTKILSEYYGLSEDISVKTIWSLPNKQRIWKFPRSGEINLIIQLLCSTIFRHISNNDIIYSRFLFPTLAISQFLSRIPKNQRPSLFYEQHQLSEKKVLLTSSFYDKIDGVICIADIIKNDLINQYNIPEEQVYVAHDGVQIDKYDGITKQSARERLDLSESDKYVMYTGHLYPDKQVETLVEASEEIAASTIIVGGYDEDISRIRNSTKNADHVEFTGFVEPSEIPYYQAAADVLVATVHPDAQYYSPLKLFEYMAAGRPIVAAKFPAFEEVLEHEKNCLLVPPTDTVQMADSINRILSDHSLRQRLAKNAKQTSYQYSWENRARHILNFISGRNT